MSNSTLDVAGPTTRPNSERAPILRAGVLASAGAAIVTTAIAAVASGAGVSFADRTGSAIPVIGVTVLTLAFSLLGVALAAGLQRRARRPRATFVRTTVALLVLSFVPDLSSGFTAAGTVVLLVAHIAAAAVVVPTLATRLNPSR